MDPVTSKTGAAVGVLLDHGLGEALLLQTLLLRSPTVLTLLNVYWTIQYIVQLEKNKINYYACI